VGSLPIGGGAQAGLTVIYTPLLFF
jgi:hypothetical protein